MALNGIIIWLSLFSLCDWSICGAVRNLLYGPKFLKKMLMLMLKMLKQSYKMSVNLEDLDVDFGLQRFKPCLLVNEGHEETNS